MELDIDFTIAAQYGDFHDCYSRNLRIFKSFVRVFEQFFKKGKFQDSEIRIDGDAKDRATIRFCSKKYRIGLLIDPADLNAAAISLADIHADLPVVLGAVTIDKAENIVFPGKRVVSLKDDYEFNNAVLGFFIGAITKNAAGKPDGQ